MITAALEELFDLNLVLVLKIWYQGYGRSHVCEAVFDGSIKTFKMTEKVIIISPAVLCVAICHKIKDIHFAMFFQDQCNLKDKINDHIRLHIESEVIL